MTFRRLRVPGALKRVALVITALAALAAGGSLAFARAKPPTPRIGSHPARVTASSSARFTLSDSQKRARLSCALDSKKFAPCTTLASYQHVADGRHRFVVRAMDSAGHASDAAGYEWTVDRGSPSTTISFPADDALLSAAGYRAGCSSRGGVCGTASDRVPVSSVTVSIRQNQSRKYWNGQSFNSRETFLAASLTAIKGGAAWFYKLGLPVPDGSYTLDVHARDALGNQTDPRYETSATFTIDTTAPPKPIITSEPMNPTSQTSASFSFVDTQSKSFQCQLDASAFKPCGSPTSYTGLSVGPHTFTVLALDSVGNLSAPASYVWIVQDSGQGQPFAISGGASSPLYPGAASSGIALKLTNPNTIPIVVTALQTSLQATGRAGCQPDWFTIAQASIPAGGITVPAGGAVTLPTQGASPPSIRLLESGSDQDACKGTTLTLSYTGSAHS